jgi:hypothetical protein
MVNTEFTGEPFYAFHRFIHQLLRADNLFFEAVGVDRRRLFQRQQPDIDAQQRLGNLIMQVAADFLSLVLLRRQNLVGQALQMLLQVGVIPSKVSGSVPRFS